MSRATAKVKRIQSSYMDSYDAKLARQIRRKQKLKLRLSVFFIVLALTVVISLNQMMEKRALYAEKQAEYNHLIEEYDELKEEEVVLIEEIELLQDHDYVLRIAKTNYFFTKEGEIVFKLAEEPPSY